MSHPTVTSRQGVAGIVEVPDFDANDPESDALDGAYWSLARGEDGAQATIDAILQRMAERRAEHAHQEAMAARAQRHEARLLEQQRLEGAAAACQRAKDAEVILNPLWAEFDSLAADLAKVAGKLMQVSFEEANRSPHREIVEHIRGAFLSNTDGAARSRLMYELGGLPAQHYRKVS